MSSLQISILYVRRPGKTSGGIGFALTFLVPFCVKTKRNEQPAWPAELRQKKLLCLQFSGDKETSELLEQSEYENETRRPAI